MIARVKTATDDGSATTLTMSCGHVLRVFLHRSLYKIWATLANEHASAFFFNCLDCDKVSL